jgi:hypothetical protein
MIKNKAVRGKGTIMCRWSFVAMMEKTVDQDR